MGPWKRIVEGFGGQYFHFPLGELGSASHAADATLDPC